MTRLAVPIMVESMSQALAVAARAAEQGADLLEFRIDRFTDQPEQLIALIEQAPLPCIITCRPTWEGGHYDGAESARFELLEKAASGTRPPAYIDVELTAYQRSAELREMIGRVVDHPDQTRPTTTGLILSSHDFTTRPADLYQRIEAMAGVPACRVIKVAWRGRSLRDNLEAFEIIEQHHKPTIAFCMGEFGLPSRVLAKKFAALLTFAAIDDAPGSATAPGQPTVTELKSTYHWDAIDSQTSVYGIIGYPIAHSLSPLIHNAGFEQLDLNAVYFHLPVIPEYESLKATLATWLGMGQLHFRGASVTSPHKENLLRFVREQDGDIEPLTERIGAANTLTRRDDGTLYASNTDYGAALDAVCHGMQISREQLAERRVAVIGAGGVARAIVAGFANYGANVAVYNRTMSRAVQLAEAFADLPGKVTAAEPDTLTETGCDVLVNCTPVGMHPDTDATPVPAETFSSKSWGPGTVVFDTIYNPVDTRLLREAGAAGCTTISGLEMFVRQAAAQCELWTARTAPIDLYRKLVTENLTTE